MSSIISKTARVRRSKQRRWWESASVPRPRSVFRVTREVRADGVTDTLYTYDGIGRLKTMTDPKDQVTTYSYTLDDRLASTVSTNVQVATPSVSFTYDPAHQRVATMVDGIGTTSYTYHPAGTLGTGQVASVDGPLTDDTIAYVYDELGRVVERAVNGAANAVAWQFDTLGRVTRETNPLGTFAYTYDGVTGRLASELPERADQRVQLLPERAGSPAADDSPQISRRRDAVEV
jgi:YD repeat-containing protein